MKSLVWCLVVAATLTAAICIVKADDEDALRYSRGPIPDSFQLNQSYPNRSEAEECRPIRLRIERNSRRYRRELLVNTNPDIVYDNSNARVMTSRMQTRLNALAGLYYSEFSVRITVLKAWAPEEDTDIDDPHSLHYEGRTVRVYVEVEHVQRFLRLAIEVGFDWIYYASENYCRLSVIPDVCDVNVDLVFMLDQSGSVGPFNHNIALNFIQNVVSFFNISNNATQVGLVTFSSGATIRFDLDDFQNLHSLQYALSQVHFTGGWTTTALALRLTRRVLDPERDYGARPTTNGIPKLAVLLTDGQSNIFPIDTAAPALRNSGVQVYTVGIGNIFLPELLFIASDPDPLHVFLLDSYADAAGFVDFLSFTACDAPAIVEPGDNTTSEIEEDEFRFFQSECAAFSDTIMIEQIDLVGTCSLYASSSKQNPGPLDPHDVVVRNEDHSVHRRSVHLFLPFILIHKLVYVSVRGIDLQNSFTIIIWDMLFNEDLYTVYVPEGVSNVAIFELTDELRMTNVTFTYSITEGNEGDYFEVDPVTGTLSVVHSLDANVHDFFLLTIVAENSQYSCHRGRVKVKVIVVRDQIQFPDLDPVSVPEDAGIGTVVTQVQALGVSVFEYAVIDGNDGDAFRINSTSGEIAVASGLDFETQDSYSLTLQATNTVTGNTGTVNQVIQIEDVNEQPFFVTQCAVDGSCTLSVRENQTVGFPVGAIEASDPDSSSTPNGMIEYILAPLSVPFQISQAGDISTTARLDRETTDRYMFRLTVQDEGNPVLSVETDVTVIVEDVNDNRPFFFQAPPALSVMENAPSGTTLTQYIAGDADIGTNADITYTLTSDDPVPFNLNPQNGLLTVQVPPDFETVQEYFFTVTASNPDGLSTSVAVNVSIRDRNDNPPLFTEDPYMASIIEHSPPGDSVLTVVATDEDSGSNGEVRYLIDSGNFENAFTIDGMTGEITISPGADIDREEIQSFSLTVQAHDLGQPRLSTTSTVVIRVSDINDNPPIFMPDYYSDVIREDASPPQDILTLFAFDLDEPGTPNSAIVYEIASGNDGGVFGIDNTTSLLRLVGELDFEIQTRYLLEVVARDQGDPPMSGTAMVSIEVLNINEFPPVINGNMTINVSERTPINVAIAKIEAADVDQMNIIFTIVAVAADGVTGMADGVFSINGSGFVFLEEELDFETTQTYAIRIQASDGDLTSLTTLTVYVLDVNEFPPSFEGQTAFQVTEEQTAGTMVGTVVATDRDSGSNAEITFTIVQSPAAEYFTIDQSTGVITTSRILDREELVQRNLFRPPASTESIEIQARDMGMPALLAVATFTIELLDVNDNAPAFGLQMYEAEVSENQPAVFSVLQVSATDSDLGTNAQISFSLQVTPANAPFEIDSTSGEVRTTASLNREEREEYTLSITATDAGDPAMSTSVAGRVQVLDQNDNTPRFSQDVYEIFAFENIEVGTTLFQVAAFDDDAGSNAAISYSIETSPDSAPFSVGLSSGSIVVESSLDHETQSLHVFNVVATDGGMPAQSATAEVRVRVGNVDETPPEFNDPCNAAVSENHQIGTLVIRCIAVDFDDVTNSTSTSVSYEIVSGNVGGTFEFNSSLGPGSIVNTISLDREERDSYVLTIRATDSVGLSTTTQVTITVLDENDNAPQFISPPSVVTVTVAQIERRDGTITRMQASDADIGSNGQFTFSISQMNQLQGDLETQLTVTVTDLGNPSLSSETVISVQFEVPCAIQSYSIVNDDVISGELLCSVEVQPVEANITLGGSQALLCNILRNVNTTSYQWIQNGSFITPEIPLQPDEPFGDLLIFNAAFQDAGEYGCRASTPIGSLQTNTPTVVRVQVPPTIMTAPQSQAVELGTTVQFSCFASGVPDPTISWFRPAAGGGEQELEPSSRILLFAPFLTIFQVQNGDQGDYTCDASNPAGSERATTMLIIFGLSEVVIVEVMEFSSPDITNNCHEFNSSDFETVMADITGLNTMTTNASGDNICNQTACHPSPCVNGSCELDPTGPGGYVCTCGVGYSGQNCDTDIDECEDDPCQNGGTCTNTPGSFSCTCTPGYTGHRCQYTDVCNTQTPCPTDLTCVPTIATAEGYVCENISQADTIVVTDPAASSGTLGDQVNSFVETQEPTNSVRRRRQADTSNNGFVTNCEAIFIKLDNQSDAYLLVWACPEGLERPSDEEQREICRHLLARGLVQSCGSARNVHGVDFPEPNVPSGPLPRTSLRVSFILLDGETSAPLSASDALRLLQQSDALERLRASGYDASEFTPAVENEATSKSDQGGMVAGIVIAVVLAVVLVVLIVGVVFLVRRRRKRANKKFNFYGSNVQANVSTGQNTENIYDVTPEEAGLTISNPYVKMPSPTKSKGGQNTFVFTAPQTLSESFPEHQFNNPIYDTAFSPQHNPSSSHSTPKKTLERGAKLAAELVREKVSSLKRRTDSSSNLLESSGESADYEDIVVGPAAMKDGDDDPDYDDVVPRSAYQPPPVPPRTSQKGRSFVTPEYEDDESIYANMQHQGLGAMGIAGERWESYWKTQTVFRTAEGSPSPSHSTPSRSPKSSPMKSPPRKPPKPLPRNSPKK